MGNSFIKLLRNSPSLNNILSKRPTAFLLLTIIAVRAKRTNIDGPIDMDIGECIIGDFRSYGVTVQVYRRDKLFLKRYNFATFRTNSKGTIAKIIDTTIYDINSESGLEEKVNTKRTPERTRSEHPNEHPNEHTSEHTNTIEKDLGDKDNNGHHFQSEHPNEHPNEHTSEHEVNIQVNTKRATDLEKCLNDKNNSKNIIRFKEKEKEKEKESNKEKEKEKEKEIYNIRARARIKNFLEEFNKEWGTRYTSSKSWEKNFNTWLREYTYDQILEAMRRAKGHSFYKDKLNPDMLFRTHEDRIGQFLNLRDRLANPSSASLHLQLESKVFKEIEAQSNKSDYDIKRGVEILRNYKSILKNI
jgi:hypothetical protein